MSALRLAVIVVSVAVGWLAAHGLAGGGDADAPPVSAAGRNASFAFAADVDPLNRKAVLDAVASARPEARRLIGAVDGVVDLRVGATPAGALGTTSSADGERYDVLLDLVEVFQRSGQRGVRRLVLHELGHVIDHALVPPELKTALDDAIPPGVPCPVGTPIGSCAPREERFAESFAKWATGDIGIDLYIGYAVPPPANLEDWGRPLSTLG